MSEAIGTAPTYVVTGILMLFLLAYGRRYFDGFVDQFGDERQRRIRIVGHEAATRGRRYLLVAIALSIVNGVVVGVTCWLLDLPAAFSLGFVVGVLTVLPLIGVIVGGIPALLLAFGLDGWGRRAVVAGRPARCCRRSRRSSCARSSTPARCASDRPCRSSSGCSAFELYGVGGAVYGIALAVIGLAALDSVGRLRGELAEDETRRPSLRDGQRPQE